MRHLLATFVGCAALCCLALAGHKATVVNGIAWRNSLGQAISEAQASHKPILLLSMFGRIDEKMPCQNARTLRATLFKEPEFMSLVKNDVIPAWEMVGPVPHVTIDLGNGRKIERTVRGNAVMYLLNSDGKVVDAYPGVYTKADFMPMVQESIALSKQPTADIKAFHIAHGRIPAPAFMTMGKAIMESPTLSLLSAPNPGNPQNPENSAFDVATRRLQDLSLNPAGARAIAATIGIDLAKLTPVERAQKIIERDSQNNVTTVRGVVHLMFSEFPDLPTSLEARDEILTKLLKVPYKDPNWGLTEVVLPGTPE